MIPHKTKIPKGVNVLCLEQKNLEKPQAKKPEVHKTEIMKLKNLVVVTAGQQTSCPQLASLTAWPHKKC